jgi:murein L,D-transpeptidase YcbB/YkuD
MKKYRLKVGKVIVNKFSCLFILIIGFAIGSYGQNPKKRYPVDSLKKAWDQTIPGNFSSQSKTVFDSKQIATFLKCHPGLNQFAEDIQSFYQKRAFAYAWYEKGTLIEQAGNLTNRVLNLQNEGLNVPAPYKHEFDSLYYSTNQDKNKQNIQLELMLTAQYFAFSKLAWEGMDDSVSKSTNWNLPRKKISYERYLDSLLKVPGLPQAKDEPVYRQYELLKVYLKKYRELDQSDPWLPITQQIGSFKPGDSSEIVRLIKIRLYKLGDYQGDTTTKVFDNGVITAIKHFQNRHGLSMNGIFDRATYLELNTPLKKRIQQIIVNMERCRWLPVSLSGDYLAVNIPEFKLHVYHGDSLLWSCDVVVGKIMHETAVFYGEVKYIVFSPYWNVPPSIVSTEVLPGIKRDPGYLSKQNMEIIGHLDGLPIIRQKPGLSNSLGLVKFLFPNSYNIYLHDTPSKSLFDESSRGFSHGCIRIKEPVKLANFLLKDRPEWNATHIDSAMQSGKERYVTLKNKVPVFIAYFTAFIDRDNQINFRKDIYNRDEKLSSMIISAK